MYVCDPQSARHWAHIHIYSYFKFTARCNTHPWQCLFMPISNMPTARFQLSWTGSWINEYVYNVIRFNMPLANWFRNEKIECAHATFSFFLSLSWFRIWCSKIHLISESHMPFSPVWQPKTVLAILKWKRINRIFVLNRSRQKQ